jgi:hypothetical protein
MPKTIVTSFSYSTEKLDIIEQAEDLAKRRGLSFSQFIISLMEDQVQKNREAQIRDFSAVRTTTDTNVPKLYEPLERWKEYADMLSVDELRKFEAQTIQINKLANAWHSTKRSQLQKRFI